MTNQKARITILGSYSGRNAGDAAILASIMSALHEELEGRVSFEVPTTHPRFVDEHYGRRFDVRGISVMPWTGSLRLLGLPTLRSIRRSDLTLITDGIIFDVRLWNPLFNFLITLIFLVPWARLCGRKVACYSVGIGPLTTKWGRRFARWVGERCDLILVRDPDSLALFREIGVEREVVLTGDAVFLDWSAPRERGDEILSSHGLLSDAEDGRLLGVNVTTYLDRWLRPDEKLGEEQDLLGILAEALVRMRVEDGATPAIVTTQIMDRDFGNLLRERVADAHQRRTGEAWAPALLSNAEYDNHELLAVTSRCRLFVGMRLHSLIIAARAGAPVVGLAYAPKVRSFLRQLETPEQSFDLAKLDVESLYGGLHEAWQRSDELCETQQRVVGQLAEGARHAARLTCEHFFPSLLPVRSA